MTGFHGAHVFIGLLLILGVLWRSRAPTLQRCHPYWPEMAEIYWHFVDIGVDRAVYADLHADAVLRSILHIHSQGGLRGVRLFLWL
jgi:hypothetical protein